jgi:hypothetical protein
MLYVKEWFMARAGTLYAKQLTSGIVLYAIVLFASIRILSSAPAVWWRIPVAIAPMFPALLIVIAVTKAFARLDELQREIQLESLAFAFAATAVLTFAYGFLEGVGFPHANWTFVWPVMAGTWLLGLLIARRKYR